MCLIMHIMVRRSVLLWNSGHIIVLLCSEWAYHCDFYVMIMRIIMLNIMFMCVHM